MANLLAIDIGTSSAKTILFDTDAAVVRAVAAQEYPIDKPAPDRAEQDTETWWLAVVQTVQHVLAETGADAVAAISLTGQMHGTVLLDGAGQPLHPAIIWADQRSGDALPRLISSYGAEDFAAITGTLPAAGFMGATLVWLAEHQPALLDQARHVLLPKDYIRYRLTGEINAEISDAASTALFDIVAGDWSDDVISSAGLPRHIFPPVIASTAQAGTLTATTAAALGLRTGIPVVAGCADQPAQALANGIIAPGIASVTTGTGGQVLTPLLPKPGEPLPVDTRIHIFNHAVPNVAYVLGAMLSAGLSLRWLRDLCGLAESSSAYEQLSNEAGTIEPGAGGLIFLPYMLGERTPHMDSHARGAFIGLTYGHSRGHMARAIMEGVAFALRQALEISLGLAGDVERVVISGGGAESAVWRQIQADVFGLPLQKTLLTEQTCTGAAMLAGIGSGVYTTVEEACAAVVRHGPIIRPDPETHQQYNVLYQAFQGLYPRLRADFHLLTEYTLHH